MRLTELEPKLNGDALYFWCPKCNSSEKPHKLGVNRGWGDLNQPFETMTLPHSIRVVEGCEAHFSIINGEIVFS